MRITVFTLAYIGAMLAVMALPAVGALASVTPEDLLVNGGFEQPLGAEWSHDFNSELSLITKDECQSCVRNGNSASKFNADVNKGWIKQIVEVKPGATYNFSGWVLMNDAKIIQIYLRMSFPSTDSPLVQYTSSYLTSKSAEYRQISICGQAPPNVDSAKLEVKVEIWPSPPGQATAYFDDLTFTGPRPVLATPSPSPSPTATATPAATAQATPTSNPAQTPTPDPSATPTAGSAVTTASEGDILINEVQYNPPQPGSDAPFEWLELFNPTGESIELRGWSIRDNYKSDIIPDLVVASRGFAIIAATEGFYSNFPGVDCPVVLIEDGAIGNGLSNDGDRLILKDGAGTVIDAISYGSDASVMSPPAPGVSEGHSIERSPEGGEFVDNPDPSPCCGFILPVGTSSPTPIASLTATTIGETTVLPESSPTATPTSAETASQPDETPAYGGAAVRAAAVAGTLALLAAAFWIGHKRKPEKKRNKERLP